MHDALRAFLKELGDDPTRADLIKTPERWIKAMQHCTAGYGKSLDEVVDNILMPAQGNDLVMVKDIEFFSLCEHHLLPFAGRVHIGYLPDKHIVGLSKMPRITDLFARRLQSQERLGKEICEALNNTLHPRGIGVVIEAKHCCVMMRGVEKKLPVVRTHHFMGEMKKNASAKEEFLLALNQK